MNAATKPLADFTLKKGGSVDPSKHRDEVFDLYSIPAYDSLEPDVLAGAEIGSSKKQVQPGDVLLSRIVPHIRRCWVVGLNGGRRQIASGEWIIFRSNDVDRRYLRHFLMADVFHGQFMATVSGVGGSLLRARPSEVEKIKIPLPPLPEQKRIAAILDKADAIRKKRKQAIALTEDLLRSTFLEMFGDPVLNPKGWEVKPLGELLRFLTSGSRGWAQYYAGEGALFLRIQNIGMNQLLLDDVAFVAAPASAEAKRTKVQAGDVLLSITADLGRTAVVPEDLGAAHINQHLAILRTVGVEPLYLSAFLASVGGQRQIQRLNREGVKAGLNFDDIRSFQIMLPPNALQEKWTSFWRRAQDSGKAQRSATDEAVDVFSALSDRAFRGEI